jgi:hypothetical protein
MEAEKPQNREATITSTGSPTATVDPDEAPIFIVGSGRSGSTLLRLMLCAHPNIYVSHEASIYIWDRLFQRSADGTTFLKYYFQTASFRWLRIDPADIFAELPDSLPRGQVGEAFRVLMKVHARRYGRGRFGDKTPTHTEYLGRIFADFADARVIHIVRDPRGATLSLSGMPWASSNDCANTWMCNSARKNVEPFADRLLEVRLEDLLENTRITMENVLDFVGEPWDDAVLDHANRVPAMDDMPPVPWLSTAARQLRGPGVRWQDMAPERIRAIELMCLKTMDKYGYEPAVLPEEPGRLRVWWTALSGIPESFRFLWVVSRLAFYVRKAQHFDDPKAKRLFASFNPPAWESLPGFDWPDPPPLPAGFLESQSP